jgi:hypothetical protein
MSATVIDLGEGFVTLSVDGLVKSAEFALSPASAAEFIPLIGKKGAVRVTVESVSPSDPGPDDAPTSGTNHRWGHAPGCLWDADHGEWGCVSGCPKLSGAAGALSFLRQAGRIVCDAKPNTDTDTDTLRRVMRLVESARVALADVGAKE